MRQTPMIKKIFTLRLLKPLLVVFSIVFSISSFSATLDSDQWSRIQSGEDLLILRHTDAPGIGDPAQFSLSDCSTQRNLSEKGRTQAKNIGLLLKKLGLKQARILSSQWCRCLDTGELLNLGKVEHLPILNSFFQDGSTAQQQNQALKEWIRQQPMLEPIILVTHQVNITALSEDNLYPESGELFFIRRNALKGGILHTDQRIEIPLQ